MDWSQIVVAAAFGTTIVSGVMAGLGGILNARKQRATQAETDARAEITRLTTVIRKQRTYIDTLWSYAVKLRRRLLAAGEDPEPIPEEETS